MPLYSTVQKQEPIEIQRWPESPGTVSDFRISLIDWQAEHMALALASSGSALVNAGMLYFYLHKRDIFRFGAHWKKLFIQFGISNAVMIVALWYALTWYNGDVSQWIRVAEVIGLCMVGVVAYAVGLLFTGFRPRHLKHEA